MRIETFGVFQAPAGRTPLLELSFKSASSYARCSANIHGRFVEGIRRCQVSLRRREHPSGAPGSHPLTKQNGRDQAWRSLLSLAAVPGLKAAADSASSIVDLYTTDSSSGGNGGASGNGSGPWGNGDGYSGMPTLIELACQQPNASCS